jgi:hypothetical protein
MAPIRAIKTTAAPQVVPIPSIEEWRDLQAVWAEDYGDMAQVPWEKLRADHIFPGCRLDSDVLEVPEEWMAYGTLRRPGSRIMDPKRAGIPVDPVQAARRDECVRRALYALWLPNNTTKGPREKGPATWKARASAFLRLAEWQFENVPSSDGSVFGALTLADILRGLYPSKQCTKGMRREYEMVLSALLDAGERDVISDYPAFFCRKPNPAEQVQEEPVRKDAEVLAPGKPATEPSVEPYNDQFVTAFLSRALWIQNNLADRLLDALARDCDVREKYAHRSTLAVPDVTEARMAAILDGDWSDASGQPLTELKYPLRQSFRGSDAPVFSTTWPPPNLKSFNIALSIVQGCNLGVVNACTGARSSEILAVDDVPFGTGAGRYASRTFKLVREIGGKPRDWPLHPAAERAIDIQRRLSRLIRPDGTNHLWVVMKRDDGSRV